MLMALRGMLSAAGMLAFNRVCWLTRAWQAMPTGERVSQMCLPSMLKMELMRLASASMGMIGSVWKRAGWDIHGIDLYSW